ncbi:hypothetical protein [Gordonibacter sp.]|uniref:hypothetical protein n=2 Tax=Gordonibacter sp. TaxID=1968902 RepID=UPI002FC79B3F
MNVPDQGDSVACICEGISEMAVMDLLLDAKALIFSRGQLLDKEVLSPRYYRDSRKFSDQYLTMDYGDGKLHVFMIQDRKDVKYALRNPYLDKVTGPCNVVTAPEIEMLMIHSLALYAEYKKAQHRKKPSVFLAERLKVKTADIKKRAFIEDFYSEHDLVKAVRTHKSKAANEGKFLFLADLLKS